jgi:hypothetical protein
MVSQKMRVGPSEPSCKWNPDDPSSKVRRLIHPKYHYRLTKLYEEKGWSGKAIEQYEKFLEIWKDADEDLPELIDAKERLAKLTRKKLLQK